jgi:hypothetical protein
MVWPKTAPMLKIDSGARLDARVQIGSKSYLDR